MQKNSHEATDAEMKISLIPPLLRLDLLPISMPFSSRVNNVDVSPIIPVRVRAILCHNLLYFERQNDPLLDLFPRPC